MSQTIPDKLVYSVPEVAELLGVGNVTIYREIQAGRLRGTKIGRLIRISAEALAEYVNPATTR